MAHIVIESGETFEHLHSGVTTTTLRLGTIQFEWSDQSILMEVGKPIEVPANTPHRMKNIGTGPATIDCGGHVGR